MEQKKKQKKLIRSKHKSLMKNKILSLSDKMKMKLRASYFRYINEQFYTSSSTEAKEYFENNSEEFKAYHSGYKQQVSEWPVNPVDIIIKQIRKKIKADNKIIIADFGCGDAKIARSLPQDVKVFSFDLVKLNEYVTVCDMSRTFIYSNSVDIAVFCLSLMGTNLSSYIREANRILKLGGTMKIADIESRFHDVNTFIEDIEKFGFENINKDLSYNMFYFLDFKKLSVISKSKKKRLPELKLNPCLYKKR